MTRLKFLTFVAMCVASMATFTASHASENTEPARLIEESASGKVVEIVFPQFDREEGIIKRKVRVSRLAAVVIQSDFSMLKPLIPAIERTTNATRLRLCEQLVDGFIIGERLDTLEELMNALQESQTWKDVWPNGCSYRKFLRDFVRIFWVKLLRTGNDRLLKIIHDAHYFPLAALQGVVDEIEQVPNGDELVRKLHEKYQESLPVIEAEFREPHAVPLRPAPRVPSDSEVTRGVESGKTMQLLAAMVVNNVPDSCILDCIRKTAPSGIVEIADQRKSVALFLLKSKRYSLFVEILRMGGASWMLDRILIKENFAKMAVIDYLIEEKVFGIVEALLGMEDIYSREFKDATLDKIIKALMNKKLQPWETGGLLQELALRALKSGDNAALAFLLSTKRIDVNRGEYDLK